MGSVGGDYYCYYYCEWWLWHHHHLCLFFRVFVLITTCFLSFPFSSGFRYWAPPSAYLTNHHHHLGCCYVKKKKDIVWDIETCHLNCVRVCVIKSQSKGGEAEEEEEEEENDDGYKCERPMGPSHTTRNHRRLRLRWRQLVVQTFRTLAYQSSCRYCTVKFILLLLLLFSIRAFHFFSSNHWNSLLSIDCVPNLFVENERAYLKGTSRLTSLTGAKRRRRWWWWWRHGLTIPQSWGCRKGVDAV